MGKTLWEMLKSKFQGPAELMITNPLKAKIGSVFELKTIDFNGQLFKLRQIYEYRRIINGETFFFTDYDLFDAGKNQVVCLRLNPVANPDEASGLTHDVIALKLYDEFGYNADFLNVVNATTKEFEVQENGVVTERYWRINDVQDPYVATVTVVTSATQTKDDLKSQSVKYWDYWRQIKDEADQPFNEFLFVDINQTDGWTQIWKGAAVDPLKVSVI